MSNDTRAESSSDTKSVRFTDDTKLGDDREDNSIDIVRFLLPAFCNITGSDLLSLAFTNAGGHVMMINYMRRAGNIFKLQQNVENEV